VYEYQGTQYNPETGEGGPFVACIKTFLKLKAEASGYPGWDHIPKTRTGGLVLVEQRYTVR